MGRAEQIPPPQIFRDKGVSRGFMVYFTVKTQPAHLIQDMAIPNISLAQFNKIASGD